MSTEIVPRKKPALEILEVMVRDPWTGNKLVGEYRHEVNRTRPSKPLFKIYSPFWAQSFPEDHVTGPTVTDQLEAHRWVLQADVKFMGLAPKAEEVEAFVTKGSAKDIVEVLVQQQEAYFRYTA